MKIENLTKRTLPIFIGFFILAFGPTAIGQKMTITKKNGTPNYIEFEKNQAPTVQKAIDVLSEKLEFTPQDEIRFLKKKTDKFGFTHQQHQQFYKGIKVQDAIYKIHSKNDKVNVMNGHFLKLDQLNTVPTLSETRALDAALDYVGATKYMWETKGSGSETDIPKGELVIVENFYTTVKAKRNEAVLAWKFNIYASAPLSRDYIYVDANTGEIVYSNSIIKNCFAGNNHEKGAVCGAGHNHDHDHDHDHDHLENEKSAVENLPIFGQGETRYSGIRDVQSSFDPNAGYFFFDQTRGNGIRTTNLNNSVPANNNDFTNVTNFIDNDNIWTAAEWDNAAKDNAALDVHWGTQQVYDYWLNVHNRDSYDGNGSLLLSLVHYGNKFNNAFWDGNRMNYGDGDDIIRDAYASLDLVAHEIGHAICDATADLAYQKESGALNEAFSDIWGAVIEYTVAPEKDTWAMFEEIDLGPAPKGSRNMANPKLKGHPDTYGGENWVEPNCGPPAGFNDNCGVHINSGVLNYWFYLLSEGGSGINDNGDYYNVSAIGIEQAAQIAYRMESVYLGVHSQYDDARVFGIIATQDIYGVGSPEEVAVTNAFYAVGLGAEYGELSYCQSQGYSVADEWIASVNIGGIVNTSGAEGYADNTNFFFGLRNDSSFPVTLTPGFTSTTYYEYWKIWIDFNADGDFEDEGETVFSAGGSPSVVTGDLILDSDVVSVETRMRVAMKYGSPPSPCESFAYGEVEDYTVTITSTFLPDCQPPENITFFNVIDNSFSVIWDFEGNHDFYILLYREVGETVYDTIPVFNDIATKVENLQPGTSIEVKVASICLDAGSQFSPIQTVNLFNSTDCFNGISSFPYTEGFEDINSISWVQPNFNDLNWTLSNGTTPNPNTGPNVASEGSNYIYVNSSIPDDPQELAFNFSPCFDLREETNATLTFDYHLFGAPGDLGKLRLDGTNDDGETWFIDWIAEGNQGNQWNKATVDLSPYLGNTVRFRFIAFTGNNTQIDMAIDNIELTNVLPEVCLDLTLTFDNYPDETSWSLNDSDGNTVASGDGYQYAQANSTLELELCVPPGCYDFTINDTYDDGICCYYGNGSYALTAPNGSVLAAGGEFGGSETTNLCANNFGGEGSTSEALSLAGNETNNDYAINEFGFTQDIIEHELFLFPNPVEDILNLKYNSDSKGTATANVFDVFGKIILSEQLNVIEGANTLEMNVSHLHQGSYVLQVINGKHSESKVFIVAH